MAIFSFLNPVSLKSRFVGDFFVGNQTSENRVEIEDNFDANKLSMSLSVFFRLFLEIE